MVNGDVTVTVAVPTITEARAIYGVELASQHIQPVWLEVKNESSNTYWFLPSGLDPDYFSQTEASPKDNQYITDGLRVVLVIWNRPTSLGGIDYFNWEQLADYR